MVEANKLNFLRNLSKFLLTLFKIRPLGVESKKGIGALKMDICILSNNRVAVLYAAVTRNSALTRIHSELAPANATKT
jgi:hypothetical protein